MALVVLYVRTFTKTQTADSTPLDINLPLTGLAFGLVWLFLKVRTPDGSIRAKLARVDWG